MTGLPEFLDTYQDAITRAVLSAYPPLYTARNRDEWGFDLARLSRRPLGAQGDAIRALALSLQRHRGTNLVGEMGTGKTTIAAAAAYLAGFRRVLVLVPPHLVQKWKREIEATVPLASASIVTTISDLERLPADGRRPLFVILSRERAKLSYRWQPAVISRPVAVEGRLAYGEDGEPLRRLCCPTCYAPLFDRERLPLELGALARKKHACERCGSPLWQADRTGPRRMPLADYIAKRMPGAFELLVIDEQHEYKGRGSAQGDRGREPRRSLRAHAHPHRDADGRLRLDALPPALALLAGGARRVRVRRRDALGLALRHRRAHHEEVR